MKLFIGVLAILFIINLNTVDAQAGCSSWRHSRGSFSVSETYQELVGRWQILDPSTKAPVYDSTHYAYSSKVADYNRYAYNSAIGSNLICPESITVSYSESVSGYQSNITYSFPAQAFNCRLSDKGDTTYLSTNGNWYKLIKLAWVDFTPINSSAQIQYTMRSRYCR